MSQEIRDRESYELISVQMVADLDAVYAIKNDDGTYCLQSWPIDALGMARVTTTRHLGRTKLFDRDDGTKIVGLELSEGYWHICDECDNFAGLVKRGDDIWEATGCLSLGDYPLRRP